MSAFPTTAPTSETSWFSLVDSLPELPISTRPVVVVAPHPDDEALAVGGFLAELSQREVDVSIVAVTDGEASHPGTAGLADRRRAEQDASCAALGLTAEIDRLGLPDGAVHEHEFALLDHLLERCDYDTVVVAPWELDGHTDHDACGRVACAVAGRVGATLLAYPVWAWQWAQIADLEGLPLRKITLSPEAQQVKAEAIACHTSQLDTDGSPAILSVETLARFHRPIETVIHVQ